MLIYNTTFQVDDDVHDNFLIWIKESYIPEVQKHGALKTPRICRILSHREEGSAYSLQWEVEMPCYIRLIRSSNSVKTVSSVRSLREKSQVLTYLL